MTNTQTVTLTDSAYYTNMTDLQISAIRTKMDMAARQMVGHALGLEALEIAMTAEAVLVLRNSPLA
jgi:hypothetical protein